jgi:hypothetical protein
MLLNSSIGMDAMIASVQGATSLKAAEQESVCS